MKFGHVAIAVKDIRAARTFWKKLGLKCSRIYDDPWFDFIFVKVDTPPIRTYLMEPKTDRSPIAQFIRKHGPGLHHISFRVNNLEETTRKLRVKHLRLLKTVDEDSFSVVTFLDPKQCDVLVELNQSKKKPPWG